MVQIAGKPSPKATVPVQLEAPEATNADAEFISKLKQRRGEVPEPTGPEIGKNIPTRQELREAGFDNAEINEYLGVEDEKPIPGVTHPLVANLIGTADYLTYTLPQTAMSVATGSAGWFLSKGAGAIVGLAATLANPEGGQINDSVGSLDDPTGGSQGIEKEKMAPMEEAKRIEELIAQQVTFAPTDERARTNVEILSNIVEWATGPAREVGMIAEDIAAENPILRAAGFKKLAPWIRYITEFGAELLTFKMLHKAGEKAGTVVEKGITKAETKIRGVLDKKKVAPREISDVAIDYILRDTGPEKALADVNNSYTDASGNPITPEPFSFEQYLKEGFKKEEKGFTLEEYKKSKAQHKTQIETIEKLSEEPGRAVETAAVIKDSTDVKFTELEALIQQIKETPIEKPERLVGERTTAVGERKGKVQTAVEIKPTEIPKEALDPIREKVSELLELKKVAEKATGQNLNSFYNDAINAVLKDSPEQVQIEIVKPFRKQALGKQVYDEVARMQEQKVMAIQENVEKESLLRKGRLSEQEELRRQETIDKYGLQGKSKTEIKQDVEFGKQYIDFLEKEMSDLEAGAGLKTDIALERSAEQTRIISRERYLQAKQNLESKFKELRSGIDPEMIRDAVITGIYHIEKGFREFGSWSKAMIKQHGAQIEPYLERIWDVVKIELESRTKDIKKQGYQAQQKYVSDRVSELPFRPRKFLQTASESSIIAQETKAKIPEIDPQTYKVDPNAESSARAQARITKDGPEIAEKWAEENVGIEKNAAEAGAIYGELVDKYQAEKAFDKATEIVDRYASKLTAGGKFIQSAARYGSVNLMVRLTPEGFIKWVQKTIDRLNENKGISDKIASKLKLKSGKDFELTEADKSMITERINTIRQMPDGAERSNAMLSLIDEIAKKNMPPRASELIDAFRYQNMLSGWQTHERNLSENMLNVFFVRPSVLLAKGIIDPVEATLTGKAREAYISDVPLYYKHTVNAFPQAVEAFRATWRGDVSLDKPELLGTSGRGAKGAKFGKDIPASALEIAREKNVPRSLTVIARFLEASDRFNSTLLASGEYAINLKRGMTEGDAIVKAHQTATAMLYREDISVKEIADRAKSGEFSIPSAALASMGKLISEGRKLPGVGQIMSHFVPFMRTPINRAIMMVEHSPLGMLRRPKGLSLETKARIMAGSVATSLGWWMSEQGEVTWAPPTNDKEKEIYYYTKQPFSVRMPGSDLWVPIWYMGPFALAFALPAAHKYYVQEQTAAYSETQAEKMADIVMGTARFVGSQSSVQSIGAFFNMMAGDTDAGLMNQLGFISEQYVPGSGFLRNVNKLVDPVFRKPDGLTDAIARDMPYFSKQIQAYKDPTGEDAKRPTFSLFGTEFPSAILPYEIKNANDEYADILKSIKLDAQLTNIMNALDKEHMKDNPNEREIERLENQLEKAMELL